MSPETAIPQRKAPPGQTARLDNVSFPGGIDNRDNAPKAAVAQAKIDLLVDDIGCNLYAMIAMLNAAIAMYEAADSVGLVYALRRIGAYWRPISGSAKELIAADAERLSALRQEGAQ